MHMSSMTLTRIHAKPNYYILAVGMKFGVNACSRSMGPMARAGVLFWQVFRPGVVHPLKPRSRLPRRIYVKVTALYA